MAISSPLNPGVIAPERRVTPQKVQNFISGGAPLGSTVVASAANKIVGFQRGAAAVAPQAPDLGSIIKTLSSNILTNVENRIQSINQNVNQFVTERLGDLGKRFREKVDKIDSANPSKILSNFLGLYRNAIDYIRFFANPNNVKNLANNLESLQKVFAETFDVATKIRRTIIRIVDQLSTLPTASAGGSGLNLDVRVPGGGLKKSAPGGLMRAMRRRPGMMLGGAALAGGGAALATSALAKVGQDVEAVPTETGGGLSGPMLDKFNEILDRFSRAINSLANTKPQQKQSSSSSGSSTAAKPSTSPSSAPGAGPGGTVDPSQISADTPEAKAFLATVGSTEAGSYNTVVGGEEVPELTKMTFQEVYDMAYSAPKAGTYGVLPQRFGGRKISYGGLSSNAAGRYQFHPKTMMSVMSSAGLKPTDLYSPENQDKIALAHQVALGGDPNKQLDEKNYRIAGSMPAWEGMRKISYAEAKKRYDQYLVKAQGSPTTPQATAQAAAVQQPGITPASTQQQTQQQVAQQVSQPVIPVSSAPQVTVVPIGGQQGSQQPVVAGGGGGSKQPLPFLPSGNADNFLTLYSRIVYNIVDG